MTIEREEKAVMGESLIQVESQDIISWFDEISSRAGAAQTETLRRIVELNHDTEYLRRWLGIDEATLRHMDGPALESLFTSLVPLVSHSDIEPYIQKIADGDASPILTQDPITMLSLSSGTTDGRPKHVPFTRFSAQSTLHIFKLAAAYRSRVFPTRAGGRILEFIYGSKTFETKGGLAAGTATTHYFQSEEFKTKQRSTATFTCSPQEVICGGDYKQATYCHLLLGLVHSHDVEFVTSTFAYSIVQALSAFQELWKELCDDIAQGTVSATRVTLPKMRRAVAAMLTPNQASASVLETKCRELACKGWYGLIPELWPNAKYIYSIMTGSMLPYVKKLRHYAGALALVSAEYGSTESWIGANLTPSDPPDRVVFTVIPTFSYFEFIPLSRRQRQEADDFEEGEPLPLSKVKVGEQYEVVLTTYTGLYRYRLGDVVEVAGFYRGAPQLSFVCRKKLILTVNIDKNTEKDLQMVVEKGSRLLSHCDSDAELVDFTSHADATNQPGHYVVYWEIKGVVDSDVFGRCCSEMDASFTDHGYIVSRRSSSIGPLELRVVREGTFRKIMEYYIANGAAMSQFKTPRCTSNEKLLMILDRCTVNRFWSTAYG